MKLFPNQLEHHLEGELAAVYALCGDEPLQVQEAAARIRQVARQAGYSEREVFNVEAGFDWGLLTEAQSALSLFSEKRLLELRLPSGKPGERGTQALLSYLQRPAEDSILLITLPRLDSSTLKSRWAKSLVDSPISQVMTFWPPDSHQLSQWIKQRLASAGLSAPPEGIQLLAARVEGNLLAAAQEVEKLKLLAQDKQLDLEIIQSSVADSARYDVFGLVDTALSGQAANCLRMLNSLRGEGVDAPFILWVLTRELRLLARLSQAHNQGISAGRLFSEIKPIVMEKHRPLLLKALHRHQAGVWAQLLLEAQQIDARIKGQAPGNSWEGLTRLCLALAGHPIPLPLA